MSDHDTKWRLETIDWRLDRLDQALRDLRDTIATLERTIVRGHGDRITRLENRVMTPPNREKDAQ